MKKSLLHLIVAGGVLALITGFMPLASAMDVTSKVTIVGAGQCGLTVDSGSPINYGSLTNNQESTDQQLTFKNADPAAVPGVVNVRGGNWIDTSVPGNPDPMSIGNTHWSANPGKLYVDKATLSNSDVSTGITAQPGALNSLYWQLKPSLSIAGYQGNVEQILTLSIVC